MLVFFILYYMLYYQSEGFPNGFLGWLVVGGVVRAFVARGPKPVQRVHLSVLYNQDLIRTR